VGCRLWAVRCGLSAIGYGPWAMGHGRGVGGDPSSPDTPYTEFPAIPAIPASLSLSCHGRCHPLPARSASTTRGHHHPLCRHSSISSRPTVAPISNLYANPASRPLSMPIIHISHPVQPSRLPRASPDPSHGLTASRRHASLPNPVAAIPTPPGSSPLSDSPPIHPSPWEHFATPIWIQACWCDDPPCEQSP
jgi:hypothetical protein